MMRRAWLLEPWRTRVLWLSLALNVFCLALLAGPFWMGQPPGPPGIEAAVERMARSLGPDDAARFRTVIANERPWFAQARRQLDESRVALSAPWAAPRSTKRSPRLRGCCNFRPVGWKATSALATA